MAIVWDNRRYEKYRAPLLAGVIVVSLALAVFHDSLGIPYINFPHALYFAAVMAGILYGRRSTPLIVALGLVQALLIYRETDGMVLAAAIEGVFLIVLAYIMGMLSDAQGQLNARLRDSDRLLQSSEASYRAIFNAASDAIVLYDPAAGRLLDANEAWVQLTGYSIDDIPGIALEGVDVREEKSGRQDMMRHVAGALRGESQLFQWQIRRKDGSVVRAEVNLKKIAMMDRDLLIAVIRDIGERQRAEEALRESEAKFRALTESTASAIVILQDERVRYANPAVEKIVGYTVDEMLAMSPMEAISVIDPASILQLNMVRFLRKGSGDYHRYEIKLKAKGGKKKWVDVTTGMIAFNGRPAFLATGFDITERKQAEEKLRASLHEKEVLLKEVHHRVKNNLQVVSSMLSLQSMSASDPAMIRLLQESQDRVRSMALIHEKLYKSGDLARINFEEYVRNLTSYLLRSYRRQGQRVDLSIDVSDILLSIDQAIPCGLIINELVSNSLKYAFPDGRAGRIIVAIRREGRECTLRVADDGVGFPAHVDYRNHASLGLQLVNTLVAQLEGNVTMGTEHGTAFTIRFPVEP